MLKLTHLSATELAVLIQRKEISCVEALDAYLAEIEQQNPELNAFVEICQKEARNRAVDQDMALQRGDMIGPLHGVPVSIKSSIAVAGRRWETGSRLRQGLVAEKDAVLVSRLRGAGAIILGTTNVAELLMAWETDNLLYGRTNNPWDLSRTPGGSSGGEAAAISSGCSAAGVGSDGGGSIRIPAHFTGICGLKPTPGRIPSTGHFPESLGPFAMIGVVGPMARTVSDLKLMFGVMQGQDSSDTSSAPVPLYWPSDQDLRKLRIGYFEDDGRTPVTAETRTAIATAVERLRCEGFEIHAFRPDGLEKARQLWWKFFGVAGGMMLESMIRGRESEISPVLQQFIAWTRNEPSQTGESLLDAWMERDKLRAKVFAEMREFQILLCPVAAISAFRHGERSWQIEHRQVEYLNAWSYCEWFNLLGMPALTLPVGESEEGFPIGVQLAGLPWNEELLLEVAAALEGRGTGWRPPSNRSK